MVYIQSNEDRKLPHHFDVSCAMYGAWDNSQETRLTTFEEVSTGKMDLLIPRNLFCGSVEFMLEVWKRIGKNPSIPRNSNREETRSNLLDARNIVNSIGDIFIKPVKNKLFTGMVFNRMTISSLKDLDDSTDVIMSKPFECRILSEWRCYVHFNRILDIRNYSGDQWILPSREYAESILKENHDFPDSYTMDLGVLENKENVVIEFNDAWSTGNYGIDNSDYYKYLRTRYFQIVRN